MTQFVHVHGPARLHFGFFGFGRPHGPQWGGVGVMVEPPAIELTIRPAKEFAVGGSLAARVEQFATAAIQHWKLAALPACQIDAEAPSEHTGLGVGTQLGLSIGAGLRRFLELPPLSAEELATSVGRGRRSAVGTHGFLHGGLIIDAGKEAGQPLGVLSARVAVPDEWRFVLLSPASTNSGLSGDRETQAFSRLPQMPGEITQELWRLTEQDLLPALHRGDCDAFGEAVYHFGRFAGECFATVQGGPFASDKVGKLVDAIRDRGIEGVGQSSWGPTVFAIVPSQAAAVSLTEWLDSEGHMPLRGTTIARPNNTGATIS